MKGKDIKITRPSMGNFYFDIENPIEKIVESQNIKVFCKVDTNKNYMHKK